MAKDRKDFGRYDSGVSGSNAAKNVKTGGDSIGGNKTAKMTEEKGVKTFKPGQSKN